MWSFMTGLLHFTPSTAEYYSVVYVDYILFVTLWALAISTV